MLANNDRVDMSNDFGCQENHFGRELCVTIVIKIGILFYWLSETQYRVYTTGWYTIGKLGSSALAHVNIYNSIGHTYRNIPNLIIVNIPLECRRPQLANDVSHTVVHYVLRL